MTVSLSVSPECAPPAPRVEELLVRAVELALARCGWAGAEVSLALVGDEEIRELNRRYRGLDRPTDVLSFPLLEPAELEEARQPLPPEALPPDEVLAAPAPLCWRRGQGEPVLLGDVIVSLPRARAQAAAYGHSLEREACFLAVHGTLHLLGYDHDTPEGEAAMTALAEEVLGRLGLARPGGSAPAGGAG